MNYFDQRVEAAVRIIWVERDLSRGQGALEYLKEAAEAGDGDACYFLGRCYCGPSFVDPAFGFEENDPLADDYFKKSIERGSAVGMFATMRVAGFRPPNGTYVHPPFSSLKEIWDVVYEMSEAGNVFCMYLIAIALYYGDVVKFLDVTPENVSEEVFDRYLHEWIAKSVELHEKCVIQGLSMSIGFLISIYNDTYPGIPKQPQRARELMELGASRGIGRYESMLGRKLYDEGVYARASELLKRALSHGYRNNVYWLAKMHTFEGTLPLDLELARNCFEMALEDGYKEVGCFNNLGKIYFYGGQGIWPDYDKAYQFLSAAYQEDNDWGTDMLGTCYLKGLGVPVDYHKAKELLKLRQDKVLSALGLGEIYAYGLGQPADIKAGMECWKPYKDDPRVSAHMQNFRKKLFGWERIQ